jgi:hypothetical protein
MIARIREANAIRWAKPVKTRPPATLADVDLAGIRTLMASTIEKAKADDPRELRKRIQELERKLNQGESHRITETREVRVEVPVLDRNQVRRIQVDVENWILLHKKLAVEELDIMLRGLDSIIANTIKDSPTAPLKGRVASLPVSHSGSSGERPPQRAPVPPARPVPPAERSNGNAYQMHNSSDERRLGKGERKVLAVLAQWPDGRAQKDVAFLAGYSAKASTLGVILSNLRRAGLVEAGQPVKATSDGLAAAGGVQDLPSGSELLEHWMRHPRIGEGERKVLRALIAAYPKTLTHAELCECTGYSADASTIGVILSRLRKLGLVENGARRVPDSFMEAVA